MTSKAQAQLRRLRVFNAAKAFMALHNRAPDLSELEDYLPGMHKESIRYHLIELDGAAGLPFPTVTGRTGARIRRDRGDYAPTNGFEDVLPVDRFTDALARGDMTTARVSRKELFGSIDL